MKIAILTIPPRMNFGGILQMYALQKVLESKGHEVVILDKPHKRKLSLGRSFLAYSKRFIYKFFLRKKTRIFEEHYFNKTYPIVSKNIKQFVDEHLHLKIVKNLYEIKSSDFDAFVVGSDQIWRKQYNRDIKNSFLYFARHWNVKRYAYAASFGIDEWDYSKKETEICSNLLKKFDFVSVREISGEKLCEKYLDVHACLALDPTLLLTSEDYLRLVKKESVDKYKGCLVCYILDDNENKKRLVQKVSEALKIRTLYINAKWNTDAPVSERIQPSVELWLAAFAGADFVVTDSFHGTVFSIIFEKNFFTITNASRGLARMKSLLSVFGLSDRLVENAENLNFAQTKANYDLFEQKRNESLNLVERIAN